MTTLNLQVATSLGDVQMGSNANDVGRAPAANAPIATAGTILQPGSHGSNDEYSVACRFPSVTVPNASTINSATFKLVAQATYASGGTIANYVSAQAADNAAALNTTNGDLRASIRARSTATTVWTQNSVTVNTTYSIDVTAVVQEIVNRAGWSSGNAIVILLDTHANCTQGEWQDYYSFDGSSGNAPRLDIDYTVGGGGTKAPPFRERRTYLINRRRMT